MSINTTLIIGGYGFFGARIALSLSRNHSIRLLIGGRDWRRGARLCRELGLPEANALAVDAQNPDLPNVLRANDVGTVVHAAGPFQGQNYAVARAAIDAGCHYIDLADGRQFVAGISCLDALASSRGVTVVSGASSVPSLSSAVIDRYLPQFRRLESVRVAISSGARAPGIATVRAVFGYAGKPIRRLIDGDWTIGYGWRDLERHRFPDPVGSRWIGTCDVPDLDLLPARYPTLRTATFQAGFASNAGHLLVWSIAGLVKAGVLASMLPFASPLNRISRLVEPIVSHRGGMFVTMEGQGQGGESRRITWNLIAERNHGPFIPCGAAIVLAQKLAAGVPLPEGAMPCMGLITVTEYLAALEGLAVREIVE
jgi:saccharopine dehydrogenase-like NADP-dependent oxidoreductase